MEKLRGWMQNVSGMMVGLSRRERIFVKSALVFVIIFLLVRFVIIPFSGQQARLNQSLDGEKEKLAEMLSIQKEVASVSRKMNDAMSGLDRRGTNFTLFSFLDRLAGEAGVKDSITYMKPTTEDSEAGNSRLSLVEMKLEAVSLENLVTYVYKIETSSGMVFVKRLSLSRHERDTGGVDAVMQVVTVIE